MKRFGGALILTAIIIFALGSAAASEYAFGSKVLPREGDLGRIVKNIPNGTAINFWDIGPSPNVYDSEDVVYLDTPPLGTVSQNDVRLTPFDIYQAGSKARPGDKDLNSQLRPLAAAIQFLDLHDNGIYDLSDPVYVHQTPPDSHGNKQAPTDAEDSPDGYISEPSYPGDCWNRPPGTYCVVYSDGYTLLIHDSLTSDIWDISGYEDGKRIEVIHGKNADYYHIAGTSLMKEVTLSHPSQSASQMNNDLMGQPGPAVEYDVSSLEAIKTNDVRLSTISNLTPGTKVSSFDPDQNKLVALPFLVSFPMKRADYGVIRYYDADGNGIYDYLDDIYMDISFGGNSYSGLVSINDVRLSGPAI